jgi:uncharacterized 2Fe-2S/4Fe-4S cluster protein (DUF4445 family)
VDLHCNGHHAVVEPGSTLFDCAESLGVFVPTSCYKQGKCKECLVEIAAGMEHLSEKTGAERHLQEHFRLSCQCRIVDREGTVRCHTMHRGEMRIERYALRLPAGHKTLPLDPCVTRDRGRVLLDGVEIDRREGSIHGLAMDLGTTTVVLRLFDLETGEVIADSSFENPQRFGGSDVMSRIHYDTRHRGKLLQRTLAGYITHAIEDFPVEPHSIYEMVVVGNSTMRDLFFRLNVHSIGQNPYQSVTELELNDGKRSTTGLTARPQHLLLPIHPKARVYGMPIISGHVGADAAACMAAVDMAQEERLVAIMDIGTNTELVVGNRRKMMAASCPAGPAFEGGRIEFGMPGLPSAIEKVSILADGSVRIEVIGDVPAEGICGSGLIDALGELLRTGRMNSLGRLEDGEEELVLDSSAARPITLHERDINELAQAKGANVAGLYIVCERFGCRFEDLDVFYLAGGFGRYLNVASAKRIGLIPNIDETKILQIGNAAIEGASIALLSRSRRSELEQLVRKVIHCRLEAHPDFFHYFVEGCRFVPVESSRTLDSERS